MFEFDNLIQPQCVPGNEQAATADGVDPQTCNNSDEPPYDPRCEDPVFRAANPELCKCYPTLVLKPEYSLIQTGDTVQYSTYLRACGDEELLESGLEYSISDLSIGTITPEGGLLTGSAPGMATVSVSWQNLTASAQVEVVESCAEINGNFVILIDNSLSCRAPFNGTYATRLAFAKEAARRFAQGVNYEKDRVAVAYFNEAGELTLAAGDDLADITAAIADITATTLRTNIRDGLETAMDHLETLDGRRTVVLFSDGENNEGDDPVELAEAWKGANHVIMGVALRAWGPHFDLMHRLATDGFFLSAHNETATEVMEALKGLKSYLCSGSCQPEPGTYPVAQLNYFGFENWDVIRGSPDLVGLGKWDVQPGNGLYVDLAGTVGLDGFTSADQVSPTELKSKVAYEFEAGKDYEFKLDVAGNNVGATGDLDGVKVTIKADDGTVVWTRTITPDAWDMPFTEYAEEFESGYTGEAFIHIELVPDGAANNVGPLIDNIVLTNLTDDAVMLSDDFNEENQTTIPVGYDSYGCIESPPGAQAADPTPPTPPMEG